MFEVGGDGRGEYKYVIESAITTNLIADEPAPVPWILSNEGQAELAGNSSHLYIVSTGPRIRVFEDSFKMDADRISVTVGAVSDDEGIDITFDNPCTDGERFQVWNNGVGLEMIDAKDDVVRQDHAADILRAAVLVSIQSDRDSVRERFLDLDVEYVGQSYGRTGTRTSSDRLNSHQTLTKILADLVQNRPDREAWVNLVHLTSRTNVHMLGPWSGAVDMSGSLANMHGAQREIDGSVLVTLAEASLIRYFQPEQNKHYKRSFPDISHQKYPDPYVLDVNSVGFTLGVKSCRLKSSVVGAKFLHNAVFPLWEDEGRRAIFDVFDESPPFILRRSDRPN